MLHVQLFCMDGISLRWSYSVHGHQRRETTMSAALLIFLVTEIVGASLIATGVIDMVEKGARKDGK